MTWLYIVWAVVALIIFAILFFLGQDDMSKSEKVFLFAILAAIWPAALCIIVVGLPFYPLHLLIEKHKKEKAPIPAEDNDEPQGYDYEEHEDWCDGVTEYEDD